MKTILIATAALTLVSLSSFAQDTSGTWTKKSFAIKGSWKIENQEISLSNFSTKAAPDLKVFLSPLSASDLNNKNATTGAILVSKLQSVKGNQRYALPEGTDLSKYKSILIHCQKYSKLWGAASLTP